MEELQVLNDAKNKFELAKRKQDASILQQIVEPLAEAIEELNETILGIKNAKPLPIPDYFDKDLNKNFVASIDKVYKLLQGFKQQEIKINVETSPIIEEIKKGQDVIIQLLNKPNQSEELQKLITLMVGKQNTFLEKELKQFDYTDQLKSISEGVNKNSDRVEKLTVKRDELNLIKEVVPIYKNK